jgi:predicted O-methyltransferase YrrM
MRAPNTGLTRYVRRRLGGAAVKLSRYVLWYRRRLEVRVAWIEARPYLPADISLDGLQIQADAAVVAWGQHPVLGMARAAIEHALAGPDLRLSGLEARIAESQATREGLVRRNAYLTAERAKPLTLSEDLEVLSLPRFYRTFLYRLVLALKPGLALELGTAHGMSASYIGAALEDSDAGHLHTIDGDAQRQALAHANLAAALPGSQRVTSHRGLFADVLPDLLATLTAPVDLVFDDGPHIPEITLEAFTLIAPHLAGGAVYVMDDIDHPTGNRRAWDAIRSRADVAAWLELNGRLGLCVRTP